ncbi:uncharacterized protein [Eurosta solidaginis]|uniref:uncharacterized protein isoform X2 n=1 Tax=Eurosta solidaginis TaxID=178769 RepID=UPI0035310434
MMDDEVLTRMAIDELIREMGEAPPDPNTRERKINPIAKPNKRFLGRTLNSIVSHNRREKERTHENCQRKLKELDDNRRKYDERELSLSSSDEEEDRLATNSKERGKRYKNTSTRKRRSAKRKCGKTKKSKSKRRASSSDSSSKSSASSSGCSRKLKKHNKINVENVKNTEEEDQAEDGNVYYDPHTNVDINLNPTLWMNCYGEQQMQQLLQYNKLIAEMETAENKDVLEELQISDVDVAEQQIDIASISTAVSSLRLDEDSTSDGSGVLQISISSGSSSSGSAPAGYKIMRKKRLKKRQSTKESKSADSGDSSNCVVLELDSDSSKTSETAADIVLQKKQCGSGDCICIVSSASNIASDAYEKDSSTDSSDRESKTSIPDKISPAAMDTVMLVTTSSDSEIEVLDIIETESAVQNGTNMNAKVTSSCQIDIESTGAEEGDDDADNVPLNLTNSHLNPNDLVAIDLSTVSNSSLKQKGEVERVCGELQTKQQLVIGSELVTSFNHIDLDLNLPVQSLISSATANSMVNKDLPTIDSSSQATVELQVVSVLEREYGDLQVVQKPEFVSKFHLERVSGGSSDIAAQPSISHLNTDDMVGIDLSKTSISTYPPFGFEVVEQTHPKESTYSSNSTAQASSPSITGLDLSKKQILQAPLLKCQGADEDQIRSLCKSETGNALDFADQALGSFLSPCRIVGIQLSTKSNSPQAERQKQNLSESALEGDFCDSSFQLPSNPTSAIPTTTVTTVGIATSTLQTNTSTTANEAKIFHATTSLMVARNENSLSPNAPSCTPIECDLVPQKGTEAPPDYCNTSTASESESVCEQREKLPLKTKIMPVVEQMPVDEQHASSEFGGSGPVPPMR